MKIAITNWSFHAGLFLVTSDENTEEDPIDIVNSDFNRVYKSGEKDQDFIYEFVPDVAENDCNYIAIGGHNFGDIGATVEATVNTTVVGTTTFIRGSANNVIMFTFTKFVNPTLIKVKVTKDDPSDLLTLANSQWGLTFDFVSPVNNSEQAGYKRAWLEEASTVRNPVPNAAQPVVYEQERHTTAMSLRIPNLQKTDFDVKRLPSHSNMYNFLAKLSLAALFYTKEYDGTTEIADNPKSSYLCFDAKLAMSVHGSTRALNNLSLNYMVYSGL